jgi:hypothetical protein
MAPRYQNGLNLDSYNTWEFTRWLLEFATQVLGWTLYDDDGDAGWTSTVAAASDVATHASDPSILDFSGAAHTLTSSDEGRICTMLGNAGWTAGEKETIGMYRIVRVDTTTQYAYLDIKRGVHEDGLPLSKSSVSYRLWSLADGNVPGASAWAVIRSQYSHTPAEPNMDVKIDAASTNYQFPDVSIGPFGTWDSGGNAWTGSRNTSGFAPHANPERYHNVFAYGDETNNNHFVVAIRGRERNELNTYYIGQITPTAGTGTDTNPGIVGAGIAGYNGMALGAANNGTIDYSSGADGGWRWMAYNSGGNDVEIKAKAMVPTQLQGNGGNWLNRPYAWSEWSKRVYRIEILLVSQTASHFEARGFLQSMWACGRIQSLTPFGSSLEYLHVNCGIAIPWNGSKTHVQWNN